MKKLVSMLMVLTLVFGLVGTCFADEKVDLNKMADDYGFKNVSEVPAHITPIVVNSEAELQKVIQQIENNKIGKIKRSSSNIKEIDKSGFELLATNSLIDFEISKWLSIGMYQCLEAKINVYSSGSFGEIVDVKNITTYIEGYTPGIDYTPDPNASGHNITNNGQSVEIWGAGDVEYYILIDGFLKLFNKREKIEGTYYL